jgi:hypothetical protein
MAFWIVAPAQHIQPVMRWLSTYHKHLLAAPGGGWVPNDIGVRARVTHLWRKRLANGPCNSLGYRTLADGRMDVGELGGGLTSVDCVLVQALYSQTMSFSLHLSQRSLFALAHWVTEA